MDLAHAWSGTRQPVWIYDTSAVIGETYRYYVRCITKEGAVPVSSYANISTITNGVAVSGVALPYSQKTISIGETLNLTASVSPDNATNKKVTWESRNPAVASVDAAGKVTALQPGTATIKVTTADRGYSASCAVTVRKRYTITYVLNGGTNSSQNPSYYDANDAITLKDPSKLHYTFDGWYSDAAFKTRVTKIPRGSARDYTLYAKWSETVYSVKYVLNGGINSPNNPATFTYFTDTVILSSPTKASCTFQGWYSDAALTTRVYRIWKGTSVNKTFYAKWLQHYSVSYVLNGGTNNAGNPYSYTSTTYTFILLSPTRAGYTFAGWYSDAAFTTRVYRIWKGSTGNLKLYAKWVPKS